MENNALSLETRILVFSVYCGRVKLIGFYNEELIMVLRNNYLVIIFKSNSGSLVVMKSIF